VEVKGRLMCCGDSRVRDGTREEMSSRLRQLGYGGMGVYTACAKGLERYLIALLFFLSATRPLLSLS
jgi:hypothetical protein